MGNTDSAQQLGQRVIAARRKLEEDKQIQTERSEFFKAHSKESIKVMIDSIERSFQTCSPFLESVLLVVWKCDPKKCKDIILSSCEKVLKAPIAKAEYEWFRTYVFPSSVWMFESDQNRYMSDELLEIARNMSADIIGSMDSIFEHLQRHKRWNDLMQIQNQTVVSRQDDKIVGLLQEKGIRDVLDVKSEEKQSDISEMQTFIDSNVAVNILTTTAKNINKEFQNHIETVMGRFGEVASGPIKNVDRCQSKLENDYQSAKFPKAAKLLDLVRCSVTFNTLEQLIDGYNGLISHINHNKSIIELGRVKNGFLDVDNGGYRDIKVNVVYHSQLNSGVSMVCEIQFLFGQYLHEKKRIHKLYSVLRQSEYFKMVVTDESEHKTELKDMKDLQMTPVFNTAKDVTMSGAPFNNGDHRRCCMDSDLQLIAVEGCHWFGCIDMTTKKPILEERAPDLRGASRQTSNWIVINDQKYLSIKTAKNTIKMFKVHKENDSYSLEEDSKFGITLPSTDEIMLCAFDRHFEHIFMVINGTVLEKRAVQNVKDVIQSIELKQKVKGSGVSQMSLSNDGNFCIITGGDSTEHSYFVDIMNSKETKLESQGLGGTYAPCFINGETKFGVIGGVHGDIQIWDLEKQEVVKSLKHNSVISGTASVNNILAVCGFDKMLRLYDVRSWEVFYEQKLEMTPFSIHLTADSKYVTIGGQRGEACVVLQIK